MMQMSSIVAPLISMDSYCSPLIRMHSYCAPGEKGGKKWGVVYVSSRLHGVGMRSHQKEQRALALATVSDE